MAERIGETVRIETVLEDRVPAQTARSEFSKHIRVQEDSRTRKTCGNRSRMPRGTSCARVVHTTI